MWNDKVVSKLKVSTQIIQGVIDQLNEAPEKAAISDLIKILKEIDGNYQYECEAIDDQIGTDDGKLYEIGMNNEFYIEGLTWHKISLLLRVMGEGQPKSERELYDEKMSVIINDMRECDKVISTFLVHQIIDNNGVDENLFEFPEEEILYNEYKLCKSCIDNLEDGDYDQYMIALSSLIPSINSFLNNVKIMSDALNLNSNRLNILRSIKALYEDVFDFSNM